MKLCPTCKTSRLIFEEEKAQQQCVYCLYGYPRVPEEEEYMPVVKQHPLIERLVIPAKKYAEMKTYCELAKGEISGLGEVKIMPDKTAVLVALAVLPQANSSAATDITAETLHNFTLNMARKGRSLENWKVWWHTHYNFQTFWSHTDEENIKNLMKTFNTWLISVELNQSGSIIGRIDEKRTQYELELDIQKYSGYKDVRKKCERMIKKVVRTPPLVNNFGYLYRRAFHGGAYGIY